MKHFQIAYIAILAAITLLFQSGCDKHGQDRQVIKFTCDNTFDALVSHDGAVFANQLSAESLDYYTRTLKLSLTAKKAEVQALPLHQRYEVLLTRLLGKRAELKDLDGKAFAEWSVNNGLWDYIPEPPEDLSLGHLTFTETDAIGKLTATVQRTLRSRRFGSRTVERQQSTSHTVRFVLENGQWKYDNTAYNRSIEAEIKAYVKDTKGDENAALLELLGEITDRTIPPTIWNGMLH